jgi:hypothetical protein
LRSFGTVRGAETSQQTCHWGSIPGPDRVARSVVWICEHPYRTIRASGPDRNCEGCPVWADIERQRACPSHTGATQVEELQAMLSQ